MTSLLKTSHLALAALLALSFAARPVLAWGSSGHRITAQVAEDHLSPASREAVLDLTRGKSLALLATWPDFIRSTPAWDCAKPWHFLTVEDGQALEVALARDADTSATCAGLFETFDMPHNVVGAIDFFGAAVRGQGKEFEAFGDFMDALGVEPFDGSVRTTALVFLVHFVGDIHQPLHVGRGGDQGGNSIMTNWFDELEKLHAVWDEGLIENEGLSFSEFASFLDQEAVTARPFKVEDDPRSWAQESIGLRAQVYEIWERTDRANFLPDLEYAYAAANIGIVKDRLYRGGRRLAAILESRFEGTAAD